MDYGFSEKRNKGKDKRREKKKHPYKTQGANRSMNIKAK
jgi:hypothetical protein